MTRFNNRAARCAAILGAAFAMQVQAPAADEAIALQVRSGIVKFDATTNMSAISVHGQSNAVTAELTMHRAAGGLEIESVHAAVDPKSLSTGMGMRDQHMRKKIFTTADERLPAIEFTAAKNTCPDPQSGGEATCQVSGNLTMRGVARPFTMALKVRNDGKGYRASGDGVVKLSAFGIEPPCQLGVCVVDEVKLRLELQVKENLGLRSGGLR